MPKITLEVREKFHDMVEPEFWEIAYMWSRFSMMSVERFYNVYKITKYISAAKIPGGLAECGVWKGGALAVALDTLVRMGDTTRDIYVYDTFDGFPDDVRDTLYNGKEFLGSTGLKEGFRDDFDTVMAHTNYPKDKIHVFQGKVEDTLPQNAPDKLAYLQVDNNYYGAVKHTLETLYPAVVPGGVVAIDDYGYLQGARRAVDEYFADQPVMLNRTDFEGRNIVKIG